LDFFPPNLGAVSEELRGRFHHDFSTMGKTYAGKSSQNILADYGWNLTERCLFPVTKE
jgi:hypothetical protein